MNYPKVSVVIIASNEEETLPLCLDALLEIDYPKTQLEIIVVDNQSTDATADIIKRYPVKYIFEAKKGRGVARNRGIVDSSGEFIAFVDADCVVSKQWLKQMINGFDSIDIGGCGGALASYRQQTCLDEYMDFILCAHEQAINGEALLFPYIATCNSIFRRDALEKVNFFDPNLSFGEDVDLSWRLLLQGYRFNYVSEAIARHRHRDSMFSLCKRVVTYSIIHSSMLKRYSRILKKKQLLKPSFPRLKSIGVSTLFIAFIIRVCYYAGWFYDRLFPSLLDKIDSPLGACSRKIIWWKKADGISIVELVSGTHYTLEGAGARIYELLKKGFEPKLIITSITDEYDIAPEDAEKDYAHFTEELKENQLL